MRRFIESGVALGVILILAGALFVSLAPPADQAGAAWRAEFAQQAECVQGKYAEEECVRLGAVKDFGGEDATAIAGGVAESGGLPFGEVSATASAPTSGLAYGSPGTAGAPSARYSYLYAGKQLARFDGTNMQFVHGDHLGTGAARTNAGGTVVESSRQLPFGTQLGAVTRETDFTGKKADGGSGLDYFGVRFYAPTIGRFLEVDPSLEIVMPESPYVYTGNNPHTRTDSDGRVWDTIIDVGFIAWDVADIGRTMHNHEQVSTVQLASLGGDIFGAVVPFLAGVGLWVRGIMSARKAERAAQAAARAAEGAEKAASAIIKVERTVDRAKVIRKVFHFRSAEAEKLLQGETVIKTITKPDVSTTVAYQLKDGKLIVIIGSVGGPHKVGKYTNAAKKGEGFRELRRIRDEAIDAARQLGLKEVEVGGAAFINPDLERALEKMGFEKRVWESPIVHQDGRIEPIDVRTKIFPTGN